MSTDQITGTPSNVVLSGTDTYSDPVTITNGATVTGDPAVLAQDVRGIENDGTVTGTTTGIELKAGGSVTNTDTGTITGYKYGIVGDKDGAPATITNQGYIGATTPQAFYSPSAWGVRLNAGGTVTNTGTITGYDGVAVRNAAGSVDNAGSITAYDTGVSFGEQGGSITNEATGTITGYRNFGVYIDGNGTVDNSGLIQVTGGAPWAAVEVCGAGTVTNHENATITGGAYAAGVRMANYYSTPGTPSIVDNSGSISGFWGVYFNYGANGTLTNQSTGSIYGHKYGVQLSDIGTVINYGEISAGYYNGVQLRDGGTVINHAGGTITAGTGSFGVYIGGDNSATVENGGTIIGGGGNSAVDLEAGTNRLIIDGNAVFVGEVFAKAGASNTIELSAAGGPGSLAGLDFQNFQTITVDAGAQWDIGKNVYGVATVVNNGAIGSTDLYGLYMDTGGTVINNDGATITGTKDGVAIVGAAGTIDNSGTISATGEQGYGVLLGNGGTIDNSGTISASGRASYAVGLSNGGTLDNSGVISETGSIGYGVQLNQGGTLTNETTGTITGATDGVYLKQGGGTVINTGTITATNEYSYGVWLENGGSVNNTGSISGGTAGVYLNNGGAITNNHGGTIAGSANGIVIQGAAGTIDNSGAISGTAAGSYGVYLKAGGTITNEATGTISGVYTGVGLGSGGTLINAGTIINTGGSGDGVALLANGGSINNTGFISGGSAGAYMNNGGTIFNGSTGKIAGGGDGIDITGGSDATVENAGLITGDGAYAVEMGAHTNRLIVDAGASFIGNVKATGASNTLELAAGATPGTITGLGSKYLGFTAVSIDTGGTWTVAGTVSGFEGTGGNAPAIQGFDDQDRLDLTDLGYTSNNSFSLSNTDLLTISENGAAVATIQLSGDFTGEFFHLADDGTGGSYVTEDENPICYCQGTMIRTDRGEIAIEHLKIGDRVVTASGDAKPILWIGRRNYSGKFALCNPGVLPICFRAGSLARNVPHRDLSVSPEHAMFIDGILIPARCLVNGDTIFRVGAVDLVEYFHIELDRHDVIVAEGTLSETYVDDDNRGRFHNAQGFRKLYPNHAKKRGALYCAPRLEDGDIVERARIAIAARALRLTGRADRKGAAAAAA